MKLHVYRSPLLLLVTGCVIVYISKYKLKGGNIGIVEKAQETRFDMSPKYSRYIGIAS